MKVMRGLYIGEHMHISGLFPIVRRKKIRISHEGRILVNYNISLRTKTCQDDVFMWYAMPWFNILSENVVLFFITSRGKEESDLVHFHA